MTVLSRFSDVLFKSKSDDDVRPLTRRDAPPPRISHRTTPSQPGGVSEVFIGSMGADATSEEDEAIDSFSGKIIPILEKKKDDKDDPRNIELRKHFAFLDNGWLLLDRGAIGNSRLVQLKDKLIKTGRVKAIIRVSLSDIMNVRKRYERNHGKLRKASDITHLRDIPIQKFQAELIALFEKAAQGEISDIHFFVLSDITLVKMRINGGLETVMEKPHEWGTSMTAAVYEMCGAKGGGNYNPANFPSGQVSSSDIDLPAGLQAMRMQQAPLPLNGRYVVLRLLTEGGRGRDAKLGDLGYRACHLRDINSVRRKSEGVIFIAGPTGSGKSTTLVITLRADMKENPKLNTVTIEDPIEFIIDGAAQLSIGDGDSEAEKKRLFERAQRCILRLDPDIVMFGEVRDMASAKTVFQLSNTGHRVYSTVHASNAVAIIGRLREIGIELYNVTDPAQLTGLISQRLIRVLCPHCSIPVKDATPEQIEREGLDAEMIKAAEGLYDVALPHQAVHGRELRGIHLTNQDGCSHCRMGISGRSVVAETIRTDETFFEKIREGKTSEAIDYWLKERQGLRAYEHATQLMVLGQSSPRDVITATGDYSLFDIDNRADAVFGELMK